MSTMPSGDGAVIHKPHVAPAYPGRARFRSYVGAALLLASVGWANAGRTAAAAASDDKLSYLANCAACHGENLQGASFGPPLRGPAFAAKWKAQGLNGLQNFVTQNMPPANPGGLSTETYGGIVRLIAASNQIPTGSVAPATTTAPAPETKAEGERNESGGLIEAATNYDDIYRSTIKQREQLLAKLQPVSDAMLVNAPAKDWLHWRRSYDGLGYSPLQGITKDNVKNLTVAWALALPTGSNAITPLVHDGIMFINSSGTVVALDTMSGDELWRFSRPAPPPPIGPPVTQPRSMAIAGERLFVPTNDNHMIALDIRSGKQLWDHLIQASRGSLRTTAGPVVVHGKVIQGLSGCSGVAEKGGCFVVALDAATGNELWRFNTIAKPGEPGGDSWAGAAADHRFGGSVWSAGTYDAETNLLYIGIAQTYHIAQLMERRKGKSTAALYTDTTVALNPDTGKLIWHYQHMDRDVWDLDWSFERQIFTIDVGGKPRKVVGTIGKLGILDIVDARTGSYIKSFDMGFQNLVTSIDPRTGYKTTDPALDPDPKTPSKICPFATGVRNWPATSFDPVSHLLYVPYVKSCMKLVWDKGADWDIVYGLDLPSSKNNDGTFGGVMAIDVDQRKPRWVSATRAPGASATLATAGGVVFAGARDHVFRAYDSLTGAVLWSMQLDQVVSASPISFEAGGVQYVAVTTGGGNPNDVTVRGLTPELQSAAGGIRLWLFKVR